MCNHPNQGHISKFIDFIPVKLSLVAGWSVQPWHAPWRQDFCPVLCHSVVHCLTH